jgi:MSHA biogenesis protein MshP
MTRHFNVIRRARRSAGVGIVTAIFLLVVLAGLGVAMVSVFTTQQTAAMQDELGSRAYQAARAGIEWGVYQQMINSSCSTGPTTFPLTSGSLSGFIVSVTCAPVGTEGDPLERWVITAAACNQPGSDGRCPNTQPTAPTYVARRMEVEI